MQAGISTQREVLNSQSDVIESETNYINSIKSYKVILSTLSRLTGLEADRICDLTDQKIKSQLLNGRKKSQTCLIIELR